VVVDVVDDGGTAHASLQELKAAGGGKAVDSVRIFKASVAILEEESAFMFHGAGGRRADGTLLPDWNRDNHPNRDTNPNTTTLNSALNVKETRHILNMGLGITMQGQALQEEPPSHKRRRGGGGRTGATASSSTGGGGGKKSTKSTSSTSFKLHPSDYSAVKRKTGIARSDITALVVYSVPPAGVKLALEALRTLLHPYCDIQHKKVAGASTPLPRAMDLEWSR
jgi:hypothetical protein